MGNNPSTSGLLCHFNCLNQNKAKEISQNQAIKVNEIIIDNENKNETTSILGESVLSSSIIKKRESKFSDISPIHSLKKDDPNFRRHSSHYISTILFQTNGKNDLDLSKISKSARWKGTNGDLVNLQMKKAYKRLPEMREKDTNDNSTVITNNTLFSKELTQSPSPKRRDNKPIERIDRPFTEKQLQLIREIFKNEEMIIPQMDNTVIKAILNTISYIRVQKGVVLYTNDNKIDNIFYLIEKGKMTYTLDGEKCTLRRFDTIGTKALRLNTKSECILQTVERTYLFCLPVEKYKTIYQDFIEKDMEDKINSLKRCFFFNHLENKIIDQLAAICIKQKYNARYTVIPEGTSSKCIFLVVEGTVLCVNNEVILYEKKANEIFGEIPLFAEDILHNGFLADVGTTIIEIPHFQLQHILGQNPMKVLQFGIFSNAIKKCDFLNKHLGGDRLKPAFEAFEIKYLKNEQVTSTKNKRVFIPISGMLIEKEKNKDKDKGNDKEKEKEFNPLASKQRLQLFKENNDSLKKGEIYLNAILSEKNPTAIVSAHHSIVLQANWFDVLKSIKCLSKKKLTMFDLINKCRNIKLFKHLSEIKLFYIADAFVFSSYKDKQVILKDGPTSSQLFVVNSGNAVIVINTNVEVRVFKEGESFGDIINNGDHYTKKVDFLAKGHAECMTLTKEHYEDIIENNSLFNPFKTLLEPKDKTLSLDSLYYVKDLGSGTYGKVYLVHNMKKFFAMKTADIQQMCGNKLLSQYYINEKTIMQGIDHPFIVQLLNTFKTPEYIFFLMEFVEGISLREYIENKSREAMRNNQEIMLYGGILFLVLNYLQKNRIIHRDIKPDNLLIERKGFLKVIDFGIAKDLAGKDSTHTLIGTPHYMAPEIILGKHYNFAVDYWSVGVILFELFYGKFPFGTDATDGTTVFNEITEKKLAFPSDPKNKNFNDLIKQLLYKNPSKRINSFGQIKAHDFFKDYDFDELINMTAKAFYLPNITSKDEAFENNIQSFNSFMKSTLYASTKDVTSAWHGKKPNDYLSEF